MNRFLLTILVFGLFHGKHTRIDDSEVPMENTKWVLAGVNGFYLTTVADSRVAYFILNENNDTISGAAGCNSITGI
jgi:heat shock protein HslJ